MPEPEWVTLALTRLGRDPAAAAELWARIEAAPNADLLDADGVDCDARAHRAAYFAVFAAGGLDDELSVMLYDLEGDAALNPFAADVKEVLTDLPARGVKVAVISDIHFDLCPAFAAAGLDDLVEVFVLSYEENAQKPAPAMFTRALDRLAVTPMETLMVGDRSGYDGAAVELGIVTLLLPPLRSPADRRLHLVTRLVS